MCHTDTFLSANHGNSGEWTDLNLHSSPQEMRFQKVVGDWGHITEVENNRGSLTTTQGF